MIYDWEFQIISLSKQYFESEVDDIWGIYELVEWKVDFIFWMLMLKYVGYLIMPESIHMNAFEVKEMPNKAQLHY